MSKLERLFTVVKSDHILYLLVIKKRKRHVVRIERGNRKDYFSVSDTDGKPIFGGGKNDL